MVLPMSLEDPPTVRASTTSVELYGRATADSLTIKRWAATADLALSNQVAREAWPAVPRYLMPRERFSRRIAHLAATGSPVASATRMFSITDLPVQAAREPEAL